MLKSTLKYPPGPYMIDPGDTGDDSVGLGPTPPSIVSSDGEELCILSTVYEPYPDDHDPYEDGGYQGEITGHWVLFKRSAEMAEIVRRLGKSQALSLAEMVAIMLDAANLWVEMQEDAKRG